MNIVKPENFNTAPRRKLLLAIALTVFFFLGLKEIPQVATVIIPDRFWGMHVKRAERGVKARQRDLLASEKRLQDYLAGHEGVTYAHAPWWPPDRELPEIYTLRIMVLGAAENLTGAEYMLTRVERQRQEAAASRP